MVKKLRRRRYEFVHDVYNRRHRISRATMRDIRQRITRTPEPLDAETKLLYRDLRIMQGRILLCQSPIPLGIRLKFAKEALPHRIFRELEANNIFVRRFVGANMIMCMRRRERPFIEDTLEALPFFVYSGRWYKYLWMLFSLPGPKACESALDEIDTKPGDISACVFQHMNLFPGEANVHRICTLSCTEMPIQESIVRDRDIQPQLNFESRIRKQPRSNEPLAANTALVFMLRGIADSWIQPVAYAFCDERSKESTAVEMINRLVYLLKRVRFYVIALVCDGTLDGRRIFCGLREVQPGGSRGLADDATFIVADDKPGNNTRVLFFYNPPDLMKWTRDVLRETNLFMWNQFGQRDVASYSQIVRMYEHFQNNPTQCRYGLLLTDKHFSEDEFDLRKVRHAVQLFSHNVASLIRDAYLLRLPPRSIIVEDLIEEGNATPEFLWLFDEIFDSLNGMYAEPESAGKELRTSTSMTSPHSDFWRGTIHKLDMLDFYNRRLGNHHMGLFSAWKVTIRSALLLFYRLSNDQEAMLQPYAGKYPPRRINNDVINNFLDQPRRHEDRQYTLPNADQFRNYFKIMFSENYFCMNSKWLSCDVIEEIKHIFTIKAYYRKEFQTLERYNFLENVLYKFWNKL